MKKKGSYLSLQRYSSYIFTIILYDSVLQILKRQNGLTPNDRWDFWVLSKTQVLLLINSLWMEDQVSLLLTYFAFIYSDLQWTQIQFIKGAGCE